MKRTNILLGAMLLVLVHGQGYGSPQSSGILPGFTISPYFGEQIRTFSFPSDVRIHINAPPLETWNPALPTALVYFALPNGNTIEQTVGKLMNDGDDWHYDIQHIGAQTRFLRSKVTDRNIVTIYLEANAASVPHSWPTWRSTHANHPALIKSIVDSIRSIFSSYDPSVILSGHSGGGGFTFSYMDASTPIPDEVKRITFLDSDYNYTDAYGAKIRDWLNASPDHYLSVLAYNDSIALYNGQPIVSPTGGTWYRTRMMIAYLSSYFSFTTNEDADFITNTALDGRIKIILKHNPTQAILHTVQVERNGFIQTILSGTALEGDGYVYYGSRAYSSFIQSARSLPAPLQIPPRPDGAPTGSQFMSSVSSKTFAEREADIYDQIAAGNVPGFMRSLKTIQSTFQDVGGASHAVIYQVMPDYLCIGSDSDFCRIPMGPITAQRLANLFGATLPTPKLVDDIYAHAEVKLAPITYEPIGNQNEQVSKFVEHNTAIEAQRTLTGLPLGSLVGGIKKDVILSNKIADPVNLNRVVIYGWHPLNGEPIQSVFSGHSDSYVDYSHGIRFLNGEILVDSVVMSTTNVLRSETMYTMLSNETGPMLQPSYLKETGLPSTPRSYGVRPSSPTSLEILVKPDDATSSYLIARGTDGSSFPDTMTLPAGGLTLTGLSSDSLYFLKIRGMNSFGVSGYSEVLASTPDSVSPRILVVNGFDRPTSGNTYDFIRQHAWSISAHQERIASATNDAILDGLMSLGDFTIVDYILGDESTVDESFSTAEQALVKTYLQSGGCIFVSGSEIAWDLDYRGGVSDKDFFNNFLKMKYVADAPNGISGTTYQATGLSGTILNGVPNIPFDNGTHGTINVLWPDVVKPNGGSVPIGGYVNLDPAVGVSAVQFSGIFPSGAKKGGLIGLGYPFETITSADVRNAMMGSVLDFFDLVTSIETSTALPTAFALSQNYPNPFNPNTSISYSLPATESIRLSVFDILGREVAILVHAEQPAGTYRADWNATGFASGIYFCRLQAADRSLTRRMLLVR